MIPARYLLAAIVLTLLPLVVGLALMPTMPPSVPMHYDVTGKPDAFGSPAMLVTWCAVPMIFVGVLVIVLPLLGPMRTSFERFRITYAKIAITTLSAMAAIFVIVLLRGAGWNIPITSTLFAVVGVMIAMLGNWMGKIRRNFWVGIRTPWTLADERVWEITHRQGGRVMMLYGLMVGFAGVALPPVFAVAVLLIGALVLVVWAMAYSYAVSRRIGEAE